jgi:hypothetical protein
VSTVARLLLVICACGVAQAFAAGSGSNAVEEPGQPPSQSSPSPAPAPSASSTTTPEAATDTGTQPGNSETLPGAQSPDAATAGSVAKKPARVVLVDDTVTDEQLKQILAKGYKPESQARGNEVYYCRRERPLGTRFETKICKTSGRILQDELQGKEVTTRAQRPGMDHP